MERYDAAIIGSGPAGLQAALTLRIRNKSFILFGQDSLSNKLAAATRIDNYLGLPAISGMALRERFLSHLEQMGIEIFPAQVQSLMPMGDYFAMATSRGDFEADTVILAMGTGHERQLPGEEALLGRGVGYCATCDAPLYRGKKVAVLGYTEEAVHEANFLAELAGTVVYIPMEETKHMPEPPVKVLRARVDAIEGDTAVRRLMLDSGPMAVDGVFILREAVLPTVLMPGLAMRGNYIEVDGDMRTNVAGCFAAGDCTGRPHQFIRAAGQGQTAAISAVELLAERKRKRRQDPSPA